MPEKRFYPWNMEEKALELTIDGVTSDREDPPFMDYVDEEHRSVNLLGLGGWSQASFDCTISDPNESLGAHAESADQRAVAVYLICRSPTSRRRLAVPLEPNESGQWSGGFVLDRAQWAGALTMEPVAVFSRDPGGGQASPATDSRGQIVANGLVWSVYLDRKVVMPGGSIDGEWSSFSEHSDPRVSRRKDLGWFLDLDNLDAPKLLLNEDIDGFKNALNVTATHGRNASLRNMVSQVFMQQVLMELSMTSVDRLTGTDPDEADGWKKQLLLTMARKLDGKSAEQILKEWLEESGEDDRARVRGELTLAVQRHLSTWKETESAISTVGRFSDE